MGYWIFMLIMDLLIPAIMIFFGTYFSGHAPKQINSLFGYRTSMSMKNSDTWQFAHHSCGRLWRRIGWPMLAVSVLVMIFTAGKIADTVGTVGGVLCCVQTVALILSIIPTEAALKRTFDENGRRK